MLVSSLLSLLALPVFALADQSFLNTALVRTIDLGGATSLVTTTYTAKSLSSSPEGVYEVLVGKKEWESRGWYEVREKKAKSAAAGKEDGGLRWTAGEYDISSYVLPVFSPYCEPLRSPKLTLFDLVSLALQQRLPHHCLPSFSPRASAGHHPHHVLDHDACLASQAGLHLADGGPVPALEG